MAWICTKQYDIQVSLATRWVTNPGHVRHSPWPRTPGWHTMLAEMKKTRTPFLHHTNNSTLYDMTQLSIVLWHMQDDLSRADVAQPLAKKPRATESTDIGEEDQDSRQPSMVLDSDGHMTGVTAGESAQPVSPAAKGSGGHSFCAFCLPLVASLCVAYSTAPHHNICHLQCLFDSMELCTSLKLLAQCCICMQHSPDKVALLQQRFILALHGSSYVLALVSIAPGCFANAQCILLA